MAQRARQPPVLSDASVQEPGGADPTSRPESPIRNYWGLQGNMDIYYIGVILGVIFLIPY